MVSYLRKLFSKTSQPPQEDRYYAVTLSFKNDMVFPHIATLMDPPSLKEAATIFFGAFDSIHMFEFAPSEHVAMGNAFQRLLDDDEARDKLNAKITERSMQCPATKQDIYDLKEDIENLKELASMCIRNNRSE